MRFSSVSRIAIAVSLGIWGTQAVAQDTSDLSETDRKDQIVVTASSRQELRNVLSPGVVSVIYPDDTKGEQKSVPDLLDQVPGVYVRRVAGTGQYTTASIRGSAPSQVNIYIDGVPFNTSSETAADLSTLPISNIERIEVYRGIVPARFSGAPLGGAINLVTKIPTSVGATASLGARSLGGRQATISIDAPLFGGGLLLGADLDHSDGNFKYPYIAQRELNAIDFGNAGYNGTNVSDGPGHYFGDPLQGGDGQTHYAPYSQLPVDRRRINNSFLKENFLAKWKNDHFTAKYAYTYLDRDMPNPLLGVYSAVDIPSEAFPLSTANDDTSGIASNWRRRQKQRQHDAALGWQGKIGGVDLSANLNLMDQDRAYRNLDLPASSGVGSLWADYHTTRYGAGINAAYTLGGDWPVTQLFEFHAEHSYEKMRYDADGLIDSVTGKRSTDYYQHFARHHTNFQL